MASRLRGLLEKQFCEWSVNEWSVNKSLIVLSACALLGLTIECEPGRAQVTASHPPVISTSSQWTLDAPMLVSVNANGVPGNSFSLHANFSPDGTHLLFWSVSTNLVPGVPFGIEQLYMKDLTTGAVSLVSGDVNGVPGNGASFNPNNSCQVLMFSPDGTKVVFESAATNLVLGGTNLNIQIFIKDITTGAVTLVSAGVNGVQGNDSSQNFAFSPDGTKVTFGSFATNLLARPTHPGDIFVKDLATGVVTLVSADANGAEGDGVSSLPVFSPDGREVAFVSTSSNLTGGATTGNSEIYVKNLLTGGVTLVSADANGVPGNSTSLFPMFSPDGSKVAFNSISTNLAPGSASGNSEIYVKDLATGAIALVSTDAHGIAANSNNSMLAVFSPDGTKIAFESTATNLVPGGTSGEQVFVKDLLTGAVTLASTDASGVQGNSSSSDPNFSPDHKALAFQSMSSNLGVTNGTFVIFVRPIFTSSGAVVDNPSATTLTTAGQLSFSDLDVGGTHTASVAAQAGNLGTLVASVSKDTTGTGTGGVIGWNYQVDEAQVHALSATTTDAFTLTLTDDQGCTATTAIVVTDLPHDFNVVTTSDGSTSTSISTSSCPTLVVITSPSDLTVTAGQTALFSSAASGTPAPSVQWQVSTDGGATFNNVPGATSTTLTFTASLSQNGNLYRAVFTNFSGTATSRAATLTVTSPATTTTLVSSQNPSVFGQAVAFTATVSAAAPGAGTPTGTVIFQDGSTSLGTANLLNGQASVTLSALGVGLHSVTAVYSGDGNFSGSTSATLSSTVNPAPLTVKANSGSRQYGQADPSLNNVTYSGFVNGDTFAVLSGTLTCASSDAPSSPVGTYAISCSGLSSPNYLITYVPGTLTITPAPLTIEANNAARPYGANNPAFSGTITGLLNADPISATYAANSALPASPVGTYPVVPTAIGPANVLVNYTIALLNGTLTIGPEPTSLTVSLAPTSIMVGQTSTATITLTAQDMVILIDPSVLASFTLTSPVVSDILSSNGVCTPVPSATPGVASCTINVTSVEPNGRTLNSSFPGTGDLGASTGTADLIVTTALGSQTSCINSDFRKVAVPGGSYLWFNSIFKVRDVAKQKVNISFAQSKVQFQYKDASGNLVTVNQAMPDAKIVIDPSATTASTTFDAVNNVWLTTIPWDLDDNAFLTGMPWLVPAGGIPADIEPVTWCGTFASDVAGVDIGWRWAAAAYSSFSSDYTVLGVKPMNTDNDNPPKNHDRAGTPENFKQFVISGARGKGGKNYTGTYSRSIIIE